MITVKKLKELLRKKKKKDIENCNGNDRFDFNKTFISRLRGD